MNTTKLLDLALPSPLTGRAAVGLLLLRVYAGAALMQHGAHKITNPLHWMATARASPRRSSRPSRRCRSTSAASR
jgi:hypothetical protein